MQELTTIAVGIGLVISLAFAEFLGVAAGGMIVPGYVALSLHEPLSVALTLGIGVLTFVLVHALGSVMILYGRRRTVLMILVGFLLGSLLRHFGSIPSAFGSIDLTLVGYIIPGLIAIWIDRQGWLETTCALVTASVLVRLTLVLVTGGEMAL